MNIDTICAHTHMKTIDRVHEPRYSTKDFLISINEVKGTRSSWAKIRFSKVKETSEWAGDWLIKTEDLKSKKLYNNNGLFCYVMPLSALKRPEYEYPCIHIM